MAPKRKEKVDLKNLVIIALLITVVIETSLLLNPDFKKGLSKPKAVEKSSTSSERITKKKEPSEHKSPPIVLPAALKSEPTIVPASKSQMKRPVAVTNNDQIKKPFLGRIAIILDDWGYHQESCDALVFIKSPLAVAVLPGLEHSRDIAECAYRNGKEVILHLPLEPHRYTETYPDNYIIKTSMNDAKIVRMVDHSLDSVPYLVGVNNHMGSKATEDKRVMSIVFNRLKQRGLFFVDSFVTSKTICRDLARKMKVGFARRDVFLDNKNERVYIEEQFAILAKEAHKKGFAIAIGHDRPLTLQIVKEQVELLERQGFKIVKITDLLQ